MIEIKTMSWMTFLIIGLILGLLWLISNRTRIGRLLVERETPWTLDQWSRILLVILITALILVNPLFHLLTFGIFAILYYILVNKNFLSKNLMDLSGRKERINFLSPKKQMIKLVCKPTSDSSALDQKKAIDRCLFSFPLVTDNETLVLQEEDNFIVSLNITSEKYTASLIKYISNAGFSVQKIKTQQ